MTARQKTLWRSFALCAFVEYEKSIEKNEKRRTLEQH